jgi:hypothetical protein
MLIYSFRTLLDSSPTGSSLRATTDRLRLPGREFSFAGRPEAA